MLDCDVLRPRLEGLGLEAYRQFAAEAKAAIWHNAAHPRFRHMIWNKAVAPPSNDWKTFMRRPLD